MPIIRTVIVVCLAFGTGACAARSLTTTQECLNPDAALRLTIQRLEAAHASGCREDGRGVSSCVAPQLSVERLALVCPTHGPTLFANAVLADEAHETAKAQQLLDRVLALPDASPDAAALRARIAMDEGNLPFARRFLAEQIKRSPDHAGLREANSAVLYLSGKIDEARLELLVALAMGAPAWRVAYHQGLVEEAAKREDIAVTYYREAVAKNPDYLPARSRLNAIERRQP